MEKWIQITAGRGPAECCWVVAQLQKLLIKEAKGKSLSVSIVAQEKGEVNRTLNSTIIELKGRESELESFIESWKGTILWKGQSPYRKFHKRKNWFVGVNILETMNKKNELDQKDIRYEVFRSNGPGGQHTNKVSSAVRAIHLPTGVVATASESRSQQQNKKLATERLIRLAQQEEEESTKKLHASNWEKHDQLIRGNPVRTFKGKTFKEIDKVNANNK